MNSSNSTQKIPTRFLAPGIMTMMVLAMFLGLAHTAASQDLDPVSSNYQLVPAGSYVIAMDNNLQKDAGNNNYFNLKAYGLLASLLDNHIALYWAIRAGKAKDDTDFSAMATQVFPNTTAASLLQFRAGPFIAQPTDTLGFDSVVTAFNTANPTHKVNVYQLTQATWVDIRYSLFIRPRTAILNDGGSASIQLGYMTKASIPPLNYEELNTGAVLTNPDTCFTFASEPHNTSPVPAVIDSIRSFVTRGGNFLAQCAAVYNYENSSTPGFMTSRGITGVLDLFGTGLGPTFYNHPDLSFTQYQGTFDPASIPVASFCGYFYLNSGSSFINNGDMYDHYTGSNSGDIGQSAAKLDTGLGHLVFYDAGHDYGVTNDANNINGIRSYFNAMFTPSAYHVQCAFLTFSNDLAITKTARPTNLIPGQNDTFTVIVTNNGPSSATANGVRAVDTLPAGFTYVSSRTSKGTYSSGTHLWSIGAVALHESDTLVIVATAGPPDTITNTAFIIQQPFDFNLADDTAHATVIIHSCMILTAGNDTAVCPGKSVVLGGSPTASGGTSPYIYIWHPSGTLSAANDSNPTATVDTTTRYTMTVTDAYSCSATASVTVTVYSLPTPAIILSSEQICHGNKDTLTGGGGVSYIWSNTANTNTIIVSPGTSTPYSVTVTDIHHCTASAIDTVLVNPLPTPSIISTSTQICSGYKDTLIAGGGVSYRWSNGANTDTAIVSPTFTSTYSVTVTAANTCSAAATGTVTVSQAPTVTITPAPVQICIGTKDTLTAGGGVSYTWSNGANTDTIIVSPTLTTPYSVTVTGANTCTASDTISLIVNPLPTPSITLTSAQICSGNKDTLTVGGGASYTWSNAANTDTIIVSSLTDFTYTVTVTDTNSCSTTTSKTVIIIPLPTPSVSPATAQICMGSGTTLTAIGGVGFQWSNAANTDTTTVSPTTTTTYSVTVTGANTCTAAASATVTVDPVPTLNVGPDTVVCIGLSYIVPGVSSASFIVWAPDSGLSNANIVAPTFHYNDSVNFSYLVIAYDTPSGCADTVRLNIRSQPCVSYIDGPQAFSPNGDNTNDFYTLFSSQIAKYDIRIYNRWGELVYESTDLSALNDTGKGWDGNYQGKPQSMSVFVYYITATDNFNNQISKKGNITLLR